ncbi:hypothetical protein ACGFX4_09105 [Kitasatospora sp. NPDC048365]|uniref:hypothetical protein n=1 Tax=Kitasatospora sp. NPDC048365 TaxID=3364050 RepID=UPI00371AC002
MRALSEGFVLTMLALAERADATRSVHPERLQQGCCTSATHLRSPTRGKRPAASNTNHHHTGGITEEVEERPTAWPISRMDGG